MATGHWNPGYMDIVSRFDRNRVLHKAVADGLSAANAQAEGEEGSRQQQLQSIRERARDAWLQRDSAETSYHDHYKQRQAKPEPTTPRPTSATRKNKPHPPEVFLVTRLHNVPGYGRLNEVPGYHNPDATLGKDMYKVDGNVSPCQQAQRANLRAKYACRPHTALVTAYRSPEELNAIADPIQRQATEAWLKLASGKNKENVLAALREMQRADPLHCRETIARCNRPQTIPSLHRYLKEAGANEAELLDGVQARYLTERPTSRPFSQLSYTDVITQRRRDLDKTRNVRYVHRSRRGDFLLHPEWPPTFQGHQLNGLSSVDMPHSTSNR